jgi:hypothetical protein
MFNPNFDLAYLGNQTERVPLLSEKNEYMLL